jgi:NAD(P)-dependent dehydrogenase (short-subunit alcohol dehydrogenase family)
VSVAGKVAIVTGGSRGIGLAVACALYHAQAKVMICARYDEEISTAIEEIARHGGGAVGGAACDVRNEASVKSFIASAVARFGGLDILINNAGVGLLGNVETMPSDDWRTTIDTNLTGAFYCCRYAIPELRKRGGGDIINMASRSSVNAFAGGGAYCASKFGLLGLSESIGLEAHRDNIRVSCIMPGRVATDFAGEAAQDWHLQVEDVAQAVMDVLSFHPRARASRIELRPANPPA